MRVHARHLSLQCPATQNERDQMFSKLRVIPDGYGIVALNDEPEILSLILGKGYTFLMKRKWKYYGCLW